MRSFEDWLRDTEIEPKYEERIPMQIAYEAGLREGIGDGSKVPCSALLVASLEDVKRLIDSPTLTAACGCYSEKTGGATGAYFALDKVTLRVQKIIDEISK